LLLNENANTLRLREFNLLWRPPDRYAHGSWLHAILLPGRSLHNFNRNILERLRNIGAFETNIYPNGIRLEAPPAPVVRRQHL